ncbi:hypothetical protein BDW22DRAFT_959840 [Trametopsis cervina]|nr:hypothetical protein BDW22DRAFT_959840 [Trametopsis cervina]
MISIRHTARTSTPGKPGKLVGGWTHLGIGQCAHIRGGRNDINPPYYDQQDGERGRRPRTRNCCEEQTFSVLTVREYSHCPLIAVISSTEFDYKLPVTFPNATCKTGLCSSYSEESGGQIEQTNMAQQANADNSGMTRQKTVAQIKLLELGDT